MNITAHLLKDNLDSVCESEFDEKYISAIKGAIDGAHKFSFDFVPPKEMVEFAFDCISKGLFCLPFSKTYFEFPYLHKIGTCAVLAQCSSEEHINELASFADRLSDESLRLEARAAVADVRLFHENNGVIFSYFYKCEGESFWNYLCDGRFRRWTEQEASARQDGLFACSVFPATLSKLERADRSEDVLRTVREQGEIGLFLFLGAWAALNSKSSITKEKPEPKNLNKARVKKGRTPLLGFKEVTLALPKAGWNGESLGGTHASPRMHWRRGHLRHLADGKILPVSPCLVGAAEDGVILKQYRATLS